MSIGSYEEYSQFVYSLPERFPSISSFQIVLARIGATLAKLEGKLTVDNIWTLDVWELIDLKENRIRNYSYEIYRGEEKVVWYDPFAHPENPGLAKTFPHHKHILPNIKQNRIPAPGISFHEPNLPFLIQEIEQNLGKKDDKN